MIDGTRGTGGSDNFESVFRLFDGILPLKDWSEEPKDNKDRAKKLGHQQPARVGIISDFDEEDHKRLHQDGIIKPERGDDVTFWLEPDNFLFRKHQHGGKEEDQVWALRGIVDHNNVHNKKENRSTPLIDQRDSQRQGFLHSPFWIKDITDRSSQEETLYTAAGEWVGILKDKNGVATGVVPRYTAMLNAFTKAGYITDSDQIAQLKHTFKILEFTRDVATGTLKVADDPTGEGQLASTGVSALPELVNGRITNTDGDKFGELCIWSDVIFYQDESHWGPLGLDAVLDGPPYGILCYGGLLWSGRKADWISDQFFEDGENPDNGLAASAIHQNAQEFPRKNRHQWIRPWIRVPRPPVETTSSGSPSAAPPNVTTPSGESAPAVPTVAASSPPGMDFKPGKSTALQQAGAITDSMEALSISWKLYYTTDTAASASAVVDLFLGYQLFKSGETADPTTVYLKGSLDQASLPTPGQRATFSFSIPVGAVEKGDSLRVSVWRAKGDTYPGKWRLLHYTARPGEAIPSGEGGAVWP